MSRYPLSLVVSLLVCLLIYSSVHAAYRVENVPDPRRSGAGYHISDPDGQLADSARQEIEPRLQALEQAGTAQVAVVVLKAIEGDDERRFANELFAHWGIGDKQKDNGLLILLITESPRSITFETGYGLEGALPDVVCDRITESMMPALRSGEWGRALTTAVSGVIRRLDGGKPPAAKSSSQAAWTNSGDMAVLPLVLMILAVCVLFQVCRFFPKNCPKCAKPSYRRKEEKVLKEASTLTTGLARITSRCEACGYEKEEDEIIPRTTESSSSSSSSWGSGGSGGSSSWGGGSSGGGGSSRRF